MEDLRKINFFNASNWEAEYEFVTCFETLVVRITLFNQRQPAMDECK